MKTLTIGIAAYNAEKNIVNILNSLLNQNMDGFELQRIIVHSDKSSDGTVEVVKKMSNSLIQVIESTTRVGFIGSVKNLLNKSQSDVTLLLNDDILIKDNHFLTKIAEQFSGDSVGLVCANLTPLKPISFIDKALQSTQNAYYKMRAQLPDKNNIYTIDGKILALSKSFKDKLKFPDDIAKTGCVDSFIYFSCKVLGYTYKFVNDAHVYFRNPSTRADYVKWVSRNNASTKMIKTFFEKDLIDKEYSYPRNLLLKFSFIEFLKNPIGCLYIIWTKNEINNIADEMSQNFNFTWDPVTTSKNLHE